MCLVGVSEVKISLSLFVVILISKLKMFCDLGVKYYTKTESGTLKITKGHLCLYLVNTAEEDQDLVMTVFIEQPLASHRSASYMFLNSP